MSDSTSTFPTISFDGTLSDEPTTGIALYSRHLSEGLEALGVRVERLGARWSGESPRGAASRNAWLLAELPRILESRRSRLFHAVGNFNLPLVRVSGTRMVLTVHDLIPMLLPATVSARYRWQFRLWLSRSVAVADRLICDSERTRRDLAAHFPAAGNKSEIVYLGVDHVRATPSLDAVGEAYLRALGLPEQFVVYAGSLDVRKNVDLILTACEHLRASVRRVTLVLVGQGWFGSGAIERRIALMRAEGHDIRALGFQPQALFYELIRRASVFVFPSRYEGFGLPPLEAMSMGVPTVVSTAGALPEVCGDAAIQIDPDDSEGLAEAIARLLRSPQERRARAEAGLRHAATFTWERTARQTLEVYRAALASPLR